MTRQRRQDILLGVLAAILLAAALWAHGRCRAARSDAARASGDLARCRSRAARIEHLRHRPNLAGAEELQLEVLARQVERAARSAYVPPHAVTRIWPEPVRRVLDTVYQEKPTQIVIKKVSMKQLVGFLCRLTASTPGLCVKSLRLTAPRGGGAADVWIAEAVVSYLIYSPPDTSRRSSADRGS